MDIKYWCSVIILNKLSDFRQNIVWDDGCLEAIDNHAINVITYGGHTDLAKTFMHCKSVLCFFIKYKVPIRQEYVLISIIKTEIIIFIRNLPETLKINYNTLRKINTDLIKESYLCNKYDGRKNLKICLSSLWRKLHSEYTISPIFF